MERRGCCRRSFRSGSPWWVEELSSSTMTGPRRWSYVSARGVPNVDQNCFAGEVVELVAGEVRGL